MRRFFIPILAAFGLPLIAFAQSSTKLTNPLGDVTICKLISAVLNAFLIIGAPIAVVFIIIAGSKFVLAVGKSEKIKAARDNLMWTLIGIAIFFGAVVISQVIFSTVSAFLSQYSQNPLNCTL